METTDRLSLPLLVPGQAQKEVWHNEALALIDSLVAAAVEGLPTNDPPASPAVGSCYIVGDSPTGDWAQSAGELAAFTGGGWRYLAPVPGLTVFLKSDASFAVYGSSSWEIGAVRGSRVLIDGTQVIAGQAAAIADANGGTVIDLDARRALAEVLAAMRSHGLIAAS